MFDPSNQLHDYFVQQGYSDLEAHKLASEVAGRCPIQETQPKPMIIKTADELVKYIRHHIAGSHFTDVKAVEDLVKLRVKELVDAMDEVSAEIARPRDDLLCHRGICTKEECGRCSRAAKFWNALDKYK